MTKLGLACGRPQGPSPILSADIRIWTNPLPFANVLYAYSKEEGPRRGRYQYEV